jgi:hypothetical protein
MKLGDNLQAAKVYLQYKGKIAKTAVKNFQGKAVAKLHSIDAKIKLTDKLKVIKKKITERKTTIKITVNKDQKIAKIKIKGDKNLKLENLDSVLINKSLDAAKNALLTDEPTETLETQKKSKPDAPPRPPAPSKLNVPTKSSALPKPPVAPKPTTKKITTNESLSTDQQSVKPHIVADIPKPPPVAPIKTIKDTAIDTTVKKNKTKDVSRNKLLQEIKNFDPKTKLKKTNTSHPVENKNLGKNTNSDIRESLKKHLSIRRSAINPDD